ncbi:hypothetical protein LTS10_011662 [Elasticomyces elasticus]|nr:hypothetical protein LTS10_011662 [Elasticomyces elasticus]
MTDQPPRQQHQAPKPPHKSLFTVANSQSLRSQLSDAYLVFRWIIRTTIDAPSPTTFARRYVIDPKRKNDRFVVSFGLPALSGTPRVLSEAPGVRSSASTWTYRGERTAAERKGIVNAASYNYLGFVAIEPDDRALLEYAIRSLPLADDEQGCNQRLEIEVKHELSNFVGMVGCILTASGYATNLIAFPAMAASCSNLPIFLMDSESHSSMFVGAYIAAGSHGARIVKFVHNDAKDLERKLEELSTSTTPKTLMKNVWVAVEGLYSMDGTVPPLPQIVALKRKYGFRIYIDEAHSFLSIGSTGRGVMEYFGDRYLQREEKLPVSMDDVDVLGGTMSKSLSSVGGFVLCHDELTEHIEAREREWTASRDSRIPTLSLIRTLQVLKAKQTISERLKHLHAVSTYVGEVLSSKGYRISTTPGGPFIALIFDNINRVLDFLCVGRQMGLLCCGSAYPACPRGAPRIRLSLTGAHSWADIEEILRLIDEIAVKIRVKGLRLLSRRLEPAAQLWNKPKDTGSSSVSSAVIEKRAAEYLHDTNVAILSLCPPVPKAWDEDTQRHLEAGVTALLRYGLGAAGPRWMCGTSSAHMRLEASLNSAVVSCLPSVSTKGSGEQISTTLLTDASVGLLSVISVAMEPLTRRRVRRGERHLILLPASASLEVREGAAAAQRDVSTAIRWYRDGTASDQPGPGSQNIGTISSMLKQGIGEPRKRHITILLDSPRPCTDEPRQLEAMLTLLQLAQPLSITVLIEDSWIFTTSFVSARSVLATISLAFEGCSTEVQWLVYGSFATLPHLSGLQGAFCTGSRRLVEKIQFLGPGVMYTAMMPPVTAVLAEEGVRRCWHTLLNLWYDNKSKFDLLKKERSRRKGEQ